MKLFSKAPAPVDPIAEILATPVLDLPGKGQNILTMGNLFDGSINFGSAGSGKTSGFLTYLLDALLKNELCPGGLILTVKKDDRIRWEKLIRAAGRGDDLIIISPENDVKINLIEHELFRKERGKVEYDQVRNLLMECMISAESYETGSSKSGSDERFWDKQVGLMIIRLMMLLVLSGKPVTIENMRKVMTDSFSAQDVETYVNIWEDIQSDDPDEHKQACAAYEAWREDNFFLNCFDAVNARKDLLPEEQNTLNLIGDYFLKIWPSISDKTRAIIEASIWGLSEPFSSGILKSHFSQEMSPEALPENCYKKGTILLLDIPIKEYGVSAIYASAMVKKLFQLTMERRIIGQEEKPRPCFLFMDEFHLLVSAKRDYEFQSTCRSTMTASILATQSINNIKAAIGGADGDTQTKSLLSNIRNQVFCANMCRDTNVYAAELIGKDFIETTSRTINDQDQGSRTRNQSLQFIVPPEHFTMLKSGGPENNYMVESIIVSRGKKWSTQARFLEVVWDQLRDKRKRKRFFNLF